MNPRPNLVNRPTYSGQSLRKQRGASLFIALIALVSMTLAGIALVRSVDTSNLIAGNLAFRQAALHATDLGIEAAFNELGTIPLEANWPSGCTAGRCNYYPSMCATDMDLGTGTKGVPTVIDWANVPVTPNSPVNGNYNVKYVIDRLCNAPLPLCNGIVPVTDIAGKCYAGDTTGIGTKKAGGVVFSGATAVYYRVTVRVEGPRKTTSMVQALISR